MIIEAENKTLPEHEVILVHFSEVKKDYELVVVPHVDKVDIYNTYIEFNADSGEYRYIKLNTEEDLIELLAGSQVQVDWWAS